VTAPDRDARWSAQDSLSGLMPRLDRCVRRGGTVRLTRDECRAVLALVDALAAKPGEPEPLA